MNEILFVVCVNFIIIWEGMVCFVLFLDLFSMVLHILLFITYTINIDYSFFFRLSFTLGFTPALIIKSVDDTSNCPLKCYLNYLIVFTLLLLK
jgi:hypothetical protein